MDVSYRHIVRDDGVMDYEFTLETKRENERRLVECLITVFMNVDPAKRREAAGKLSREFGKAADDPNAKVTIVR